MLHLFLIILLVVDNITVNNETLSVNDFVNFKIKPIGSVHRDRVCVRVFIELSAHMCINICVFVEINTHTYINIYVCTY
jgi:hypothetical protein